MARRAVSALTAMFAFGTVAALTVILPVASPAASAATSAAPTVAFTGLNPQWASPGTTISVTGSVKNTSPVARRLVVQLLDSTVSISSVSALQESAAAGATGQAGMPLPNAIWRSSVLRPGASASWSIKVPVSVMGLTTFGVYPVAAQLYDSQGNPLNNTLTYLPYVPAKSTPYGSSVPTAQKISWVWPLIDQPLLEEPWQSVCTGPQAPQAAALAQSLASGGRLGQLVDTAGTAAGTAAVQAQAARAGAGGSAQRLDTLTESSQSLAQADAVTWAVDPALLDNASALSRCSATEPQWARTASAWLARLKETTASQPMFMTAYGDPDVASLIEANHASDVGNAFAFGRNEAHQILDRDLTPAPVGTSPADVAGLAWSTGGATSYATAESLAGERVGTLLEGSSALPAQQVSVLRTLDGAGTYMNVLLANDAVTSLLGSADTGPGSAFTTAQQFLAETALLAQQQPSAPIIVAPPQRWQPPAGLASALLRDTASAPWLTPATLTSLTAATHIPSVSLPLTTSASGLSRPERDKLSALDGAATRHLALRAGPDPSLVQAISTIESSAYSDPFKAPALVMINVVSGRMAAQELRVHIIAENRITLGGTRGNVPVSIDNPLPFAVRVTLDLSYSQADGVRVSASPAGAITVPAHTAQTVRLRVTAAQPGSTTITMTLLNQARPPQPLVSSAVRTTVQTTQVGLLGMIIFGAAIGVFLLASAARAIRRGRPRQARDEADRPAPREADLPGQSSEEAGPDTVVTGHGELGPARSPRPR